jgi:predicted acylesterase/phospholipase RssA
MTMNPLRTNIGIAIDGGGIRGLIIARALKTLQTELDCKPLINHPRIRILAGTSTGAILTGALALGMEADAIADVYREVGQQVFPRLTPAWFPGWLKGVVELLFTFFRRSLYSNQKLISVLRKVIGERTGNPDFTLADLNERIGPDKVLILTVVNITERRTHFLKSDSPADGQWKLWEAILASSSVPPSLPVWARNESGGQYYTDGGVGSYCNPAYVVAKEATVFRGYRPSEVSILSFGTGWLNAANFKKQYPSPTSWRGLEWAINAPSLFVADTIRTQSLDILENLGTNAIDFRRFQFELEKDFATDTYQDDKTYNDMKQMGDELGKRIADNQFAFEDCDPKYDPEGLYTHLGKYRAAKYPGKLQTPQNKIGTALHMVEAAAAEELLTTKQQKKNEK